MMKIKATVTDEDLGMEEIMANIKSKAKYTDIGIQSDEDQKLLIIAGANEYGATINHPGGTPYGYKTVADAHKGKVSFLKAGEGYMVLGETKPHTIQIPARSYIRSTVDSNEQAYLKDAEKLAKEMIDNNLSKFDALSIMGQKIESDIKNTIVSLRYPPNAKSTIRRKGSDNPLVDTNLLGGSIRYVVGHEGDEGDHNNESQVTG